MRAAILLNSTSTYLHVGCYLTSVGLKKLLAGLELNIVFEHEVNNCNFRRLLQVINMYGKPLIIINGEGTFHDDQAHAVKILEFLEKHEVEFVILNTQFKRMSDKFIDVVKKAKLVQLRTMTDYEYCVSVGIENSIYCPDMLFYSGVMAIAADHRCEGVVFTDSHMGQASREIARVFKSYKEKKKWVNLHFFETANRNVYDCLRRLIASCVLPFAKFLSEEMLVRFLNISMKLNLSTVEADFISAEVIVTGRYHGACLAIALKKPLYFSYSNTSKVQDLCLDFNWGKKLSSEAEISRFDVSNNQYDQNIRLIERKYGELLVRFSEVLGKQK